MPARRDLPAGVADAVRASIPPAGSIRPYFARHAHIVPAGGDWLHEIELVGVRMIARKRGGEVLLLGADGDDWNAELSDLIDAFVGIAAQDILLDGELVAFGGRGGADREALRAELVRGDGAGCHFVAFDLLHLDGWDLRRAALFERKRLLREVLNTAGRVRASDWAKGAGPRFFEQACAAGASGIVSKRLSSPYPTPGSDDWRIIRCARSAS